MSKRNVQITLLCEDDQHEAFSRRFLQKRGWEKRRIRVQKAPKGAGSAEQFVRNSVPQELKEARRNNRVLIVMIDGDNRGVKGRIADLDAACKKRGIPPRQSTDKVLFIVPTWNIETWLAYLDGQKVDETKKDYSYLEYPRECRRHVKVLVGMCQQGKLRQPAPPSLDAACKEWTRI